ncbi:MAG: N-carbamoylsarcosine amidase [Alphaproteobacteria bacterium]|nr:MAG: N-carbamoylsarcosine amidase [Alphaproteobacteria bacterium]
MSANRPWERHEGKPGSYNRVPFDLVSSCLVIIDMQRYWTEPEGPFGASLKSGFPDYFAYFYHRLASTVRPNLSLLLKHYRVRKLPVVHVTTGSARGDGMDFLFHMQRRFARGGEAAGSFDALRIGSEWHAEADELRPASDELVLNKTTRSAFTSSGIDQLLRNMRVQQLVVGGLASNACVQATAQDGADRGYETYLAEDCCAAFSAEAHTPVFENFHWIFGSVLTTGEIIGAEGASS